MVFAHRYLVDCHPMKQEIPVDWDRRFTPVEMDRISAGFRPRDMQDKWLVFQEGNWVFCHRSWTGVCAYKLHLTDGRFTKVTRNAQAIEDSEADENHAQTLDFIFDQLLLGKASAPGSKPTRYQRQPLDPELARIDLSDRPIQECKAEIFGYGAKDSGEMGGGASLAICLAGGPQMTDLATAALAATNKQIGDVAFTSSLQLEREGTLVVAHIVSIHKHTPQGAWCPEPESISHGVSRTLEFAKNLQLHSAVFSALGTGEGRVSPEDSARYMFSSAYRYRRENPDWPLAITFSLPTVGDFHDFQRVQAEFR